MVLDEVKDKYKDYARFFQEYDRPECWTSQPIATKEKNLDPFKKVNWKTVYDSDEKNNFYFKEVDGDLVWAFFMMESKSNRGIKDIADDVGTDQVSFQSKFNKLLADTKTKEQDLAKTSGTAAKFRQGQSVNQINLLQSMAKQIGITKKTQGETNKETENTYNALKKVAEEELNIGQLEEMIAESKGR